MTGIKSPTVIALSTPRGHAGLAVIRLSGSSSLYILEKIFKHRGSITPQKTHFGEIIDERGVIDTAITTYYKHPNSYTGEDVVEISVHGNPYICDLIISAAKKHGAIDAGPGEFTKRAFLNGKMDLSQAESVADIIYLSSRAALDAAADLLSGSFGNMVRQIKSKIIDKLTVLELELDFAEEEIAFSSPSQMAEDIDDTIKELEQLLSTYDLGKIIREGLLCPIVGAPNSGKSSIFNAFLKEERVIVSDTPGTTRDYVEETIRFGNHLIRLVDTAGLRLTHDDIETAGIIRTKTIIKSSGTILYVIDPTHLPEKFFGLPEKFLYKCLFIINKSDIASPSQIERAKALIDKRPHFICSALQNRGVHDITKAIVQQIEEKAQTLGSHIITRERHKEALSNALQHLKKAKENLLSSIPPEIISIDLRQALSHLDILLGKTENEEILNNIFNHFCVGK